jgi:hypothetical protein
MAKKLRFRFFFCFFYIFRVYLLPLHIFIYYKSVANTHTLNFLFYGTINTHCYFSY